MGFKKIPSVIRVGVAAEQYSRRPGIDISEMLEMLPDATPQLFVVRPGEREAKPATVTLEGTTLYWEVNGYDTRWKGNGSAQVVLTLDQDGTTKILESKVIRTCIDTTILSDEKNPPEPYQTWVTQILKAAADTTTNAEAVSADLEKVEEYTAQADKSAENAKSSEDKAKEYADAAKQSADTGAEQLEAVKAEGEKQIGLVVSEGTKQVELVTSEGTTQVSLVNKAGADQKRILDITGADYVLQAEVAKDTAIAAKTAAETAKDGAVTAKNASEAAQKKAETAQSKAEEAQGEAETAQRAAKTSEDSAKASADSASQTLADVNTAGTTQITAIQAEGSTQVTAVADKGAEVLASIPQDYTQTLQDISDLKSAVTASVARYGAAGFTNANPALTRLYDAVGLVAQVGTDGDNSNVRNDFDNIPPWNRKKCVGRWIAGEDRAVFVVEAYEGDPDYAEDGSMGDFVAVDCPPAYYWESEDKDIRVVSAMKLPGFKPFSCLESKDNPGFCRDHTYLRAYAMAADADGHSVSLPGYSNAQGDYASLVKLARNYSDSDAAKYAHLDTADVNFYEETLYDIEFATHNCQSIMQGCAGLRHSNDDRAVIFGENQWLIKNYYASRVVGEAISIQPTTVDQNSAAYLPSHVIKEIVRCDADGNASASGTCTLITVEDLGLGRAYEEGAEYRIVARPFRTGACNDVGTSSGSPVSNADSYHPMRYRYRENVFGNQFMTTMDLFDTRVGTGDADWTLDWYLMTNPDKGTATNYSLAQLQAVEGVVKLDYSTPHENYKNGYVTDQAFDRDHPEWRIPVVDGTGSASKFVCDYAYLVTSYALRSVRLGGAWTLGASAGFGYASASYAPSLSSALYGGGLQFTQ